MPPLSERTTAYRSTVVYNLGAGAGRAPHWNNRTHIPTLSSFQPFQDLARRRGLLIDHWFYNDGDECALESAQGRWRPVMQSLAFAARPGHVPSVAESVAAFDQHVRVQLYPAIAGADAVGLDRKRAPRQQPHRVVAQRVLRLGEERLGLRVVRRVAIVDPERGKIEGAAVGDKARRRARFGFALLVP
jgi:hypothetical protein